VLVGNLFRVALTYTIAGLQTELDAIQAAKDGSDFVTARSKLVNAKLVLMGLPEEATTDQARFRYNQQISELSDELDRLEAATGRNSDQARLVRTRTSHRARGGWARW